MEQQRDGELDAAFGDREATGEALDGVSGGASVPLRKPIIAEVTAAATSRGDKVRRAVRRPIKRGEPPRP